MPLGDAAVGGSVGDDGIGDGVGDHDGDRLSHTERTSERMGHGSTGGQSLAGGATVGAVHIAPATAAEMARVHAWAEGAVAWSDLAAELRCGCELAVALRCAVWCAVGLRLSVGVGRTKLVARMLSPLAKPNV